MSELKVMQFSRIHEEVEEHQDRIAELKAYEKCAKIVRLFFAIDAAVMIATFDATDTLFVIFMILLLLMMAITAHIFQLAFKEEREELEGVHHPWRNG